MKMKMMDGLVITGGLFSSRGLKDGSVRFECRDKEGELKRV